MVAHASARRETSYEWLPGSGTRRVQVAKAAHKCGVLGNARDGPHCRCLWLASWWDSCAGRDGFCAPCVLRGGGSASELEECDVGGLLARPSRAEQALTLGRKWEFRKPVGTRATGTGYARVGKWLPGPRQTRTLPVRVLPTRGNP
ncbi:hypothetical protein EDB89DRAFT_1908974 [Lactarius sanguifluus]|nr:hypothetical protein EDB89DRAFT_1908974 [Lactarius sanguifluus]